MNTKRFAGMIVVLALVTLGVLAVDHWTKDARARQLITPTQIAAVNPQSVVPAGPSAVHYLDPGETPLPPIVVGRDSEPPQPPPAALPRESEPPPLISTGVLEKQLKESIDNLNNALPRLASGEESAAPPPLPPLPPQEIKETKGNEAKIVMPPSIDSKDPFVPVLPSVNASAGVKIDPPTKKPAAAPLSDVPQPPAPLDAVPPKPLNSNIIAPSPVPPTIEPTATSRTAATTIMSPDDFHKRLTEVEMKYLKELIAELDQRMKQMPMGEERRKIALDHQRYSDRLVRMLKAADMAMDRHIVQTAGKETMTDSPWTMHLETVDGKTVLQAVVHHKAKFKVVCDRLDMQAPRGTMLAVGHVHLSGEGFLGACDRLSIPLHDDRLILEGNAEVGIRTQPMAMVDERKEGVPPLVEPRKVEELGPSPVPILHLKGDHLDLRWSDLQPTAPANTRADEPRPMIKGTPGPLVKVAFNSPANEKWSEWGTLLAMPANAGEKNAPGQYAIQNREGNILCFVRAPANLSLQEYLGKRVSVFGMPTREEGRSVMTYSVSHVAWE